MFNIEKSGHMITDPDELEYFVSAKPKSNYTLNLGKVKYYEYNPQEIIQQIETKITRKIYLASSLTKRKFQTISHNVKLSRHDINPHATFQNNNSNQDASLKNSLLCLAKIYGNPEQSIYSHKRDRFRSSNKIHTERSSYSQKPNTVHFSGKKNILHDYLQQMGQDQNGNLPTFKEIHDKRSLSYSKKTKYTKTMNYTENNEEEPTNEVAETDQNYMSNPVGQSRSCPRKKHSETHSRIIRKIASTQNGKENEIVTEPAVQEVDSGRTSFSRKQQFIRNQAPIMINKEKVKNYPLFEKKNSIDNLAKSAEKKIGSSKSSFNIFKTYDINNAKRPASREFSASGSLYSRRLKSLKKEEASPGIISTEQLKTMMPTTDRPPSRHKNPEKHSGLDLLSVIQSDETDNRNILQDLDDDLEQRLENTTSSGGNEEFESDLDRLLEISDLDNPSELSGRRKHSPNKDLAGNGKKGPNGRPMPKANSSRPTANEKDLHRMASSSDLLITKKQHSLSSNKVEILQTIESLKFKSKKNFHRIAFGVPLETKTSSKTGTENSSRKTTIEEVPIQNKHNRKLGSRSHRVLPFNTSLDKQFVGLFAQ